MKKPLEDCMVEATASIADAMRSLETSFAQIVLLRESSGRITGIVTDGDLRRALLSGATLDDPVEPHSVKSFFSVAPTTGRSDVLDLMRARQIFQVPVLDDEGRAVGLHLMHEVLGSFERPNVAVIMAGGRGTRLAPLTESIPKPMIPVAGRPILERLVLHLVGHGIRHMYLAVNYMSEVIENHFGDGAHFGCKIEYLREKKPLGTAGPLTLLPKAPEVPLLVLNGDLVTQFDVGALLDFHEGGDQVVTLGVRHYYHTVPFGCVELDGERLVSIEEKPTTTHLVNTGVYVVAPEVLELLAPDEFSTMPDLV
ncbi:MAG: CBS domain-containing protein, partial [Deltaproteobacteria bacterium]|nr:CBS domain-containing protein [Deltaproteobacteria bacterium]